MKNREDLTKVRLGFSLRLHLACVWARPYRKRILGSTSLQPQRQGYLWNGFQEHSVCFYNGSKGLCVIDKERSPQEAQRQAGASAAFSIHFKDQLLSVSSEPLREAPLSPPGATEEGRVMVSGEDLRPGPCCLLGQFPETVKHSCFQGSLSCAYAEAMPEHTAHFPRPTVPDLRGGWSLGWWRVRGSGVRDWSPGAAGLHTGPKCDAGTGTALPSGSCLLCKQRYRVQKSQEHLPCATVRHPLPLF